MSNVRVDLINTKRTFSHRARSAGFGFLNSNSKKTLNVAHELYPHPRRDRALTHASEVDQGGWPNP